MRRCTCPSCRARDDRRFWAIIRRNYGGVVARVNAYTMLGT